MRHIKNKLEKYTELKSELEDIDLKLKELELNLGVNSIGQEESTGHTYKINRSTENQALNLIEKKDKLINARKFKELEIKRIENAINSLNSFKDKNILKVMEILIKENESYNYAITKLNMSYQNIKKKEYLALEYITKKGYL